MSDSTASGRPPFEAARFVVAQDSVWDAVVSELAVGRKRTHWMWFVFPQLSGLGQSPMAWFYGLDGLDSACEYAACPVLARRLRQCFQLVLQLPEGTGVTEVFGGIDAMKLRSCATLFAAATRWTEPGQVLARFYGGELDPLTAEVLAEA